MPQTYDPDLPLIEGVQAGDPDALAELIGRHGRWVRGALFAAGAQRGELDDLQQQVWLRAWSQTYRLEDPRVWRTWLYRIARNVATDTLRARIRRRSWLRRTCSALVGSSGIATPAAEKRPEQAASDREQDGLVMAAIADLPAMYREPFVLKHLEDWSYRQIGEALGLPVDTVETRLVRARRLLRAQLTGRV